jgi:hypothetical protein
MRMLTYGDNGVTTWQLLGCPGVLVFVTCTMDYLERNSSRSNEAITRQSAELLSSVGPLIDDDVFDYLYNFSNRANFHQRFDGVMVITFASHSVRERFRVRSSVESLFLLDISLPRNRVCIFCLVCLFLSMLWIHRQSISWHWLANLCRCAQKRCCDIFFRVV